MSYNHHLLWLAPLPQFLFCVRSWPLHWALSILNSIPISIPIHIHLCIYLCLSCMECWLAAMLSPAWRVQQPCLPTAMKCVALLSHRCRGDIMHSFLWREQRSLQHFLPSCGAELSCNSPIGNMQQLCISTCSSCASLHAAAVHLSIIRCTPCKGEEKPHYAAPLRGQGSTYSRMKRAASMPPLNDAGDCIHASFKRLCSLQATRKD